MTRKFLSNTRFPRGILGNLMLSLMNTGHSPLTKWGLAHLTVKPDGQVLDIGCGGGKTVARLLDRVPVGRVAGVDYSPLSVEKSRRLNQRAIEANRAEIHRGEVSHLPFDGDTFDAVTAFETVYFWPDIVHDFREINRILRPGGMLLLCNEAVRREGCPHTGLAELLHMRVYSAGELSLALTEAGFTKVDVSVRDNTGWVCVTARKGI